MFRRLRFLTNWKLLLLLLLLLLWTPLATLPLLRRMFCTASRPTRPERPSSFSTTSCTTTEKEPPPLNKDEGSPPKWLFGTEILYERDPSTAPRKTPEQWEARNLLKEAERLEEQSMFAEAQACCCYRKEEAHRLDKNHRWNRSDATQIINRTRLIPFSIVCRIFFKLLLLK